MVVEIAGKPLQCRGLGAVSLAIDQGQACRALAVAQPGEVAAIAQRQAGQRRVAGRAIQPELEAR
ncbi:hypothetical protein GCM10017767_19050 [Halomonas urumqiensis]|nr:hypothetical protein GCM10017767_19050 [Halomonas urumqiensis]